ncbi:MAG: glutamyl-tRNA reductase [Bacilli bacterium]
MHLVVFSFHYERVPIALRERMVVTAEGMTRLVLEKNIPEAMALSTCNRSEIYLVVDRLAPAQERLLRWLASETGVARETLLKAGAWYTDESAVQYTYKVACGLTSLVLGETQILGQMRNSFQLAEEYGTTGVWLRELLNRATRFARRMHHTEQLNDRATSVAYVAVQMALGNERTFQGKRILIVGAGETGALLARHVQVKQPDSVVILNRTVERAQTIALEIDAEWGGMNELQRQLQSAELVFAAVHTTEPIIRSEDLDESQQQFFDLGVPRNVDPNVSRLPNKTVVSVDDLERQLAHNDEERRAAAERVHERLADEVALFYAWADTQPVVPVIRGLQQKVDTIHARTLESLWQKLPSLSAREQKVIGKHMRSVLNQLVKPSIGTMKEWSPEQADLYIPVVRSLYDLQTEDEQDVCEHRLS